MYFTVFSVLALFTSRYILGAVSGANLGATWPKLGPTWVQLVANLGATWANLGQLRPTPAKLRAISAVTSPTWAQLEPTWGQLGSQEPSGWPPEGHFGLSAGRFYFNMGSATAVCTSISPYVPQHRGSKNRLCTKASRAQN